jgi:hypothetical protein
MNTRTVSAGDAAFSTMRVSGKLQLFVPTRTLQAATTSVSLLARLTRQSVIPLTADAPPPVLAPSVHVFVAVHKYTFCPGAASLRKNWSPVEQFAGNVVPTFIGRVLAASAKSTFRD